MSVGQFDTVSAHLDGLQGGLVDSLTMARVVALEVRAAEYEAAYRPPRLTLPAPPRPSQESCRLHPQRPLGPQGQGCE